MKITSTSCYSQHAKSYFDLHQILWQVYECYYHHVFVVCIVSEFQKLVRWLVYEWGEILRTINIFFPFEPYLPYYLFAYLGKDVPDLCKPGYRTYEEQTNHQEFSQILSRMIRDVHSGFFLPTIYDHSHLDKNLLSTPNIFLHCRIYWMMFCLLSPRSAQGLLKYTYSACRVPFDVPNPGRLTRVAGT
jgi:hypothetical protein